MKDGRASRKQWGSGRAPKGLGWVDLNNPGVKELLRRLNKIEASSSSSSDHAELASPNPCVALRLVYRIFSLSSLHDCGLIVREKIGY